MPYVETTEESFEMTFQSFEVVSNASIESLPIQPRMSDTVIMVAWVMLGHSYEPIMGLGKNKDGMVGQVDIKGNCERFELGYKPTRTDVRKNILERRNKGQGSQPH